MSEKSGTARQRRATNFENGPALGMSACALQGPEISIVPMRYALDRSPYDPDPGALTPLLKSGQWQELPALQSRQYTLRQLSDGYVYVFDEKAGALHEYLYSAKDAGLSRIVWTDAHVGKDERTSSSNAESRPYLSYSIHSTLHIAYAPVQWTWRICEHMRSHAGSRELWMRRLDLYGYCKTAAEPQTLPLTMLAEAVADIDAGHVIEDQRFNDTSIACSPILCDQQKTGGSWAAVGADVHWLGSVPEKNDALLIALDDPLAVLNDLGMQLAADQAAYQCWQAEHEHTLEIGTLVTRLCGMQDEPQADLPASVRGDADKTHAYLQEVEHYLTQHEREENVLSQNAVVAPGVNLMPSRPSHDLRSKLLERYNTSPSAQEIQSWMDRSKWRREVDLEGARAHRQHQQPRQQQLLQQIKTTRNDLQRWAEHIGIEPMALFIDTGNPRTLLYLQAMVEQLLTVLTQDEMVADWLIEQDAHATTLFGTLLYGFSPALKDALNNEADKLLNGLNDYTNLGTRLGELNSVLNHSGFADAPWMMALKQLVQETFKALRTLASSIGQETAQRILMAFTPVQSRLAKGRRQNLRALVAQLLIGQVLSNSPQKLTIDREIGKKIRDWNDEHASMQRRLKDLKQRWLNADQKNLRRHLSHSLSEQQSRLKAHQAKMPQILDYQNNQYAHLFQQDIHDYIKSAKTTAIHWQQHAKNWVKHLGAHGVSLGWGVIMLNLINTALIWEEVSRDGTLSTKDMVKVGYSVGWSFNLLMAMYAEVPWPTVKNAKPLMIGRRSVSILDRSSAFWRARGNVAWADAVGSFRTRLLGTALFAIGAAWLEIWDLKDDYDQAKTDAEKKLLSVKILSVFVMGAGGLIQIAALFHAKVAAFAMGPWFAVAMLAVGLTYLLTTLLINFLKQDSIGSWLRKCCWTHSPQYRFLDTPEGRQEEKRAIREIILSPQVMVKQTFEIEHVQRGRIHTPMHIQNGAWVQILIPNALRDHFILFNAITSKRTNAGTTVEATKTSIQESFLENGDYKSPELWGKLSNQRPRLDSIVHSCPALHESDDVIWQTWIPACTSADFVEMQIWHPIDVLKPSPQDPGYLYQLTLRQKGDSAVDGLGKTELSVKNENRRGAWELFVVA